MQRLLSKLALAGPVTAMVVMLAAPAAHAQQTYTLDSGTTTVKLAQSFVSALGTLGVTPGTIGPSAIKNGKVSFPITGGAIDVDTAVTQILHSGGLTLTAGPTQVRLESFIIDTTGTQPIITGLVVVDKKLLGRLPLFDLALPSGLTLPLKSSNNDVIRLTNVGVSLGTTAASALNSVFKVSAFQPGFAIGTAQVVTIFRD